MNRSSGGKEVSFGRETPSIAVLAADPNVRRADPSLETLLVSYSHVIHRLPANDRH